MFQMDEELRAECEENVFRFPSSPSPTPSTDSEERLCLDAAVDKADTPTTVQKNLCLSATSELVLDISDDDEDHGHSPTTEQKNLCLNASYVPSTTTEGMGRTRSTSISTSFPYHTHQITDDYRISSEIIGIGESGKVMACYAIGTGEKFALKVLRDGPKARREVDLHYLTCGHENVVKIIDIYENTFHEVKCLLMVVEFLEGGDLLSRFESQGSKPLSEKKVGEIVRQIGSAVQFLHDMNIAHRDIKLENILCSSKDEHCVYKLGDFGFAKRPERNTLMQSPCCTPFYAPPEVISRESYDKSCDMWSLGVAMYILLCGYPPFYSMAGAPLSPGMKTRIQKGYYAFPHAEWDPVSQETKDDIRCLLKTNPAERMTIHDLMLTPLVRGQEAPVGIKICKSQEEEDAEDEAADAVPPPVPKSVRFLREGVKAPRLHSIQEEVGRALEMMRLGGDSVWVKSPKLSCNSLLARRRSNLSIPQMGEA